MNFDRYERIVKNQLENLGLASDDINNIIDSTEGQSILRINFHSNVSASSCIDDILFDAPDYILDQIN